MTLKEFLEEALVKGENIKSEIISEISRSPLLRDFSQSDLFARAVSTVVKTKDEVSKFVREHVKTVMCLMDVPTRTELSELRRRLDHLDKSVDRVGKKAITIRSLKKIHLTKAAKKR